MPTKKYLRKKANKLCLMGQKSQLSGILTEPLNPREKSTFVKIIRSCVFTTNSDGAHISLQSNVIDISKYEFF